MTQEETINQSRTKLDLTVNIFSTFKMDVHGEKGIESQIVCGL